jgi:cytochrome c-type biogenesis protein CcmH
MSVGEGRPFRPLLVGFMVVLAAAAPVVVEAQRTQDRPNAEEAEAAIAQLRSPYCPGLMLEVCPSASASALRDSIYDLAAEGQTADQLVEWMLARHGEEWRGVPQRSGAGLLAWLIPPLALLIGAGVVVGWMRANRAEAVQTATPMAPITDADRERLSAALQEWEESSEDEV